AVRAVTWAGPAYVARGRYRSLREPLARRVLRSKRREVAVLADRARGRYEPVGRRPREPSADADALRAGGGDLVEAHPRQREHVHRPRDGRADRGDGVGRAQARRIEDVCACGLVGPEARDRVGELGIAADVALRTRRDEERERQRLSRRDSVGQTRDGVVDRVERAEPVRLLRLRGHRASRLNIVHATSAPTPYPVAEAAAAPEAPNADTS